MDQSSKKTYKSLLVLKNISQIVFKLSRKIALNFNFNIFPSTDSVRNLVIIFPESKYYFGTICFENISAVQGIRQRAKHASEQSQISHRGEYAFVESLGQYCCQVSNFLRGNQSKSINSIILKEYFKRFEIRLIKDPYFFDFGFWSYTVCSDFGRLL